ncbi:hypothetical protein ACFRJ1_09140 [Streptomyces sp. NPDC056773]|uniref:hypothetical protein n=1 Tax=unclassified Streptomyces TaxID=2593676 RepID=UPI0036C97DEE
MASDLRAGEERFRWPVFALEAVTAGAVAVFAFPLRIGGIGPGVLDLYSEVAADVVARRLRFSPDRDTDEERSAADDA